MVIEVTAEGTLRCVRLDHSSGSAELDALALRAAASTLKVTAADVDGRLDDSEIHYTYRFEIDDEDRSPVPWWKSGLDQQ